MTPKEEKALYRRKYLEMRMALSSEEVKKKVF